MSMSVHKVQSCFETFCMSDFGRLSELCELVPPDYVQLQQKKRHYCNYVRINFIKKKMKLHQLAR